ncbi:hypothetical protein [Dickeya zeae]|uniref:hypothetical protein n=1 Tax=Dickeya zeae TaxID=204042 RepID=UPI0013157CD0|nr:hypothetical protein [Dickeya zeae]UJR60270.1 hypothetical protein HJ580_19955 [Dickeya zeae]
MYPACRVEQANPALLGGISYWETENGDGPMTEVDERGVCQQRVTGKRHPHRHDSLA